MVKEDQCAPIIKNAFKLCGNGRDGTVKEAVAGVAWDLWDWSRNILGDLEKRINKKK